jgi:hypothetical protein
VGVHDGLHVGPRPQKLGVDRELSRWAVAVVARIEIVRRVERAAIEIEEPDVGRLGEPQSLLTWPPAAHEHRVATGAPADMAEDILDEAAMGQQPARTGQLETGRAEIFCVDFFEVVANPASRSGTTIGGAGRCLVRHRAS